MKLAAKKSASETTHAVRICEIGPGTSGMVMWRKTTPCSAREHHLFTWP